MKYRCKHCGTEDIKDLTIEAKVYYKLEYDDYDKKVVLNDSGTIDEANICCEDCVSRTGLKVDGWTGKIVGYEGDGDEIKL